MKKELFIVSLFAATSIFAATELVSNSMSVLPDVTPPCTSGEGKHLMLVTAPFAGYGSSANITVADVLLTDGLSNGDILFIQSSAKGTYDRYTFNGSGWTPAKKITINSNGTSTEGSVSADVAQIQRGKPFWLETEASSVTLLGQTASQDKQAVLVTSGDYNLVAPTTSENPVELVAAFGANGDRILLASGVKYMKVSGAWKQVSPTRADASAVVIPVGVGFWYMPASGSSITL